MKILEHFQQLNLTSDQRIALEMLNQFIEGDDTVFLLKGYAGTGKTTLLNGLCQYINDINREVSLLAPTGRAAMVLGQKTKKSTSTIHRSIYNMDELIEKKEGSSFKFSYGLRYNEDSSNSIYIVDEASMISNAYSDDEFFTFGSGCLLDDFVDFVTSESENRKIIFVGDQAQLPPVNMNFSPALDEIYLSKTFQFRIQEASLSEVVRQSDHSGILKSATAIRSSIEKNSFNTFVLAEESDDISSISSKDFLDSYTKQAKELGVANSMVITHSNKQAQAYNQVIRNYRYKVYNQIVRKDDILMITKNNYNGSIELYNGMFAKVLDAGEIKYTCKPRFTIKGGEVVERNLAFREIIVEVTDVKGEKHSIKTTLLDAFLNSKEGRLHPYDQRALYIDFKERMAKEGIKPGDKDFKDRLRKDLYFNALQAKYGYAITCHKSQGGEWDNLFIDFDVNMGKNSKAYFRWAYTAITRASKKIHCINLDQYNAFSSIVIGEPVKISRVLKGHSFTPKKEGEPNYFVTYRWNKIEEFCELNNIKVTKQEHQNQLLLNFSRGMFFVNVKLWYSKDCFVKKEFLICSEGDFKVEIEKLLIDSLIPNEVPFIPKHEFQKELYSYFIKILDDECIPLMNIVQNEWNDQYFIHTGSSCALMEFAFDKKGVYTKVSPKSTDGVEDKKLAHVVEVLSGLNSGKNVV
ncbi:AAA family ATPase [bacterium]|nr:AAA family ATPase [bacterium]